MKARTRLVMTAAVLGIFAGLVGTGGVGATAADSFKRLDPAAFEERMKNEAAMVINVHIPYEGELEGTDAFIPYNEIKGDSRLPEDKGTELLLYCRSGHMSEEAANDLLEEGYTNIAHLEGGMKAWEASGRKIVYNPENAARTSGPHQTPQM